MKVVSPNDIPLDAKVYIHATDTCYGFAARWNDAEAIALIQQLKGRKADKPFSLLFSDIVMLEKFVQINEEQEVFVTHQGEPSSFVLPKKAVLTPYFRSFNSVSCRIEDVNFPVQLSTILHCPVTSTSVNKSGEEPLYSAEKITKIFEDAPDDVVLIDSGDIPKKAASSIWDLTQKPYKQLR